ncbi:uncharacterized protein LOC117648070 [Thrips palmi]|uniref:Uncharacterized protein LOC117648070 n=1 Tax=Thrips palmi TaxID=161013 RepID=A0A6P8Z0X7_THRPL|nr:uncharacterized protein LOC117648070 [Thrips palmi]
MMSDLKWRIGAEAAEVAEVNVTEDTLRNFPNFLNLLEECGQIKAKGAIKVCLPESCVRKTSLGDLLSGLMLDQAAVQMQIFYRPDNLVFGYRSIEPRIEDSSVFLNKANHPAAYSEDSCCSSMFAVLGTEALFDHYWKILDAYAENVLNPKESIMAEVEKLLAGRGSLLAKCNDMKSMAEDISPFFKAELKHHSRPNGLGHRICNNCDISGTLESDDPQYNGKRKDAILHCDDIKFNGAPVEIFSGFSLSRLNTILNFQSAKYPGLARPSFYVGSTHSSFVARIEHASLWSINFLHYGHWKVWYVIPPGYVGLVDFYLSQVRLDLSHRACRNILGHKHAMLTQHFLDKYSIPHIKFIQKPGEFVIIHPNAIHFGFNMGNNISEAVNFATVSWIPYGLTSPTCACFGSEEMHLDMTPFLVAFQPDQLRTYLEGGNLFTPEQHPFSHVCAKFSHPSPPIKDRKRQISGKPVSACISCKDTGQQLEISRTKLISPSKSILQCPACNQSYRGGMGRLNRLLTHIRRHHSTQLEHLEQLILKKYKKKQPQQKKNCCPICYKLLSGSAFHLNDHIRRMHHPR